MSRQLSFVLVATIVAVVVHQLRCMPNGAPAASCFSMTPGHGFSPQQAPSPFVIELANELKDGSIKITIRSKTSSGFKGFLLLAFDNSTTDDATPIGSFSPDVAGLSKINPCGNAEGALTHTNRLPKARLVVTWTPPDDFEDFVVFKATFVQSYHEFWVKERSPVVRVQRRETVIRAHQQRTEAVSSITTTITAPATLKPSTITTSVQNSRSPAEDYTETVNFKVPLIVSVVVGLFINIMLLSGCLFMRMRNERTAGTVTVQSPGLLVQEAGLRKTDEDDYVSPVTRPPEYDDIVCVCRHAPSAGNDQEALYWEIEEQQIQ